MKRVVLNLNFLKTRIAHSETNYYAQLYIKKKL